MKYSKDLPLTPQMLRDFAEYNCPPYEDNPEYGINGYPEQARAHLWEPFRDPKALAYQLANRNDDDSLMYLCLFEAELLEDELK